MRRKWLSHRSHKPRFRVRVPVPQQHRVVYQWLDYAFWVREVAGSSPAYSTLKKYFKNNSTNIFFIRELLLDLPILTNKIVL